MDQDTPRPSRVTELVDAVFGMVEARCTGTIEAEGLVHEGDYCPVHEDENGRPLRRPGPKTFDDLKAQEAEREGRAPYDDGGRQPCGCSPEFHGARCTGPR